MNDQFLITGFFYEDQGYRFQKFLNIKLKASQKKVFDLMVIMMNPGSSKPMDEDTINREIETKPDNTQEQIMRIMVKSGFEFARILNLSDFREGNSKNFFLEKQEIEKNIKHSIFNEGRTKDFNNLFVSKVPVLYVWGVNDNLKELAKKAIQRISISLPIGCKSEENDWGYYYPLRPSVIKKKKWIKNILVVIKENKVIVE